MGRRNSAKGNLWLIVGLAILALVLMIPKEVWIALFWIAVLCGCAWWAWRKANAPHGNKLPSPDVEAAPPTSGKTLAELIADSRRPAPRHVPTIRSTPAPRAPTSASPPVRASRPVPVPDRPAPATEPLRVRISSLTDAPSPATTIRQREPPRWIPLGETVSIRGQEIRGGGFYFGTPRRYEQAWASTVDPTLPYSTHPDWCGEGLNYWPRYAGIGERERGTFLAFLNSERSANTVGISYVFLYFYGLEHRLLRGLPKNDRGREEGEQIISEIQRLQRCYGTNASFRRYSDDLLTTARFVLSISTQVATAVDSDRWGTAEQLAAAQLVAARQPLPTDLAFLWTRAISDEARSSTWDVVLPELKLRFSQLYRSSYPDGLQIQPGRSKYKLNYRWASPDGGLDTIETDLPDITRTVAPMRPLIALMQQAVNDLTPLRRVRRSKDATELAELAAMPETLRALNTPESFKPLEARIDSALADTAFARLSTKELLEACNRGHLAKVGKRDATTLAQALEAIGYGMEPDVRFLGQPLAVDGTLVVFRLPHDASRSPSPAYSAAMLMIQSALAVAGSGDEISESELLAVTHAIEAQFALPERERQRLEAHVHWLLKHPPSIGRLDGRVRLLPQPQREAFASVLVDIAGADGHVSPAEVRIIERFYRALALEPSRMHADLHHASMGTTNRTTGRGAPAVLDADVIAEKLAETARVQSVLAKIFADEESAPNIPVAGSIADVASTPSETRRQVAGLDPDHSALLESILQSDRDEWPRQEFESACEGLGLLPDGAMEMLNEASFSQAGEALLEGDDPLYINDYARSELRATLPETNTEPA